MITVLRQQQAQNLFGSRLGFVSACHADKASVPPNPRLEVYISSYMAPLRADLGETPWQDGKLGVFQHSSSAWLSCRIGCVAATRNAPPGIAWPLPQDPYSSCVVAELNLRVVCSSVSAFASVSALPRGRTRVLANVQRFGWWHRCGRAVVDRRRSKRCAKTILRLTVDISIARGANCSLCAMMGTSSSSQATGQHRSVCYRGAALAALLRFALMVSTRVTLRY